MAKYSNTKAKINEKITTNTTQAITGNILNEVLQTMVDSLGADYQFGGLVQPGSTFTAGEQPVVFLATTPGTYTNFGSLVVADGEVALLVWSGTAWSKQTPDIATRTEVSQLGQQVDEIPIVSVSQNTESSGKTEISVGSTTAELSDSSAQDIVDEIVNTLSENKVDISLFVNGYVQSADGEVVNNSYWKRSDFIPIKESDNIVYSNLETNNVLVAAIAFYSSNSVKGYISSISNIGAIADKRILNSSNIPSGAKFVRFTIEATDVDKASIVIFPNAIDKSIAIKINATQVNSLLDYYVDTDGIISNTASFTTILYNISNIKDCVLHTITPISNRYVASFALYDTFNPIGATPLAYGGITNVSNKGEVDLKDYPTAVCCAVTINTSDNDTTEVYYYANEESIGLTIANGHNERCGEQYRIAAMSANTTFYGLQNGIEGNKQLTFTATINAGSFNGVKFGQGYNQYGGMFVHITATGLYVYKNANISDPIVMEPHHLTISSFIAINIRIDRDTRIHIRVVGDNGFYDMSAEIYLLCSRGQLFLTAATALKDITISSTSNNYNSKVWFVGDSFIAINDVSRWGYYLINEYKANPMVIGYPGAGAENVLPFVKSALAFGNPKYIVWCVGMNNPDEGAINSTWKTNTDAFIALCKERGIVPILQLIPNCKGSAPSSPDTPTHLHDYKNAYILSLGYRTIDIPTLVQADADGNWRTGWHSIDYIHPNENSSPAIALAMITSVPECLNEN